MSCSECRGRGGSCPICSEEPNMVTCHWCNGDGYTKFYDVEGNRIKESEYYKLPEDERIADECQHCEGTGKIEYDPFDYVDYDDYDE